MHNTSFQTRHLQCDQIAPIGGPLEHHHGAFHDNRDDAHGMEAEYCGCSAKDLPLSTPFESPMPLAQPPKEDVPSTATSSKDLRSHNSGTILPVVASTQSSNVSNSQYTNTEEQTNGKPRADGIRPNTSAKWMKVV